MGHMDGFRFRPDEAVIDDDRTAAKKVANAAVRALRGEAAARLRGLVSDGDDKFHWAVDGDVGPRIFWRGQSVARLRAGASLLKPAVEALPGDLLDGAGREALRVRAQSWLDGAVVITTGSDRWKARAIDRGLDTARIWVGDYGRWKKLAGRNEAFRQAPHFDAKGAMLPNDALLLERLLAQFERKYPDEIGRWRDKMRSGYLDGSRVLLRYTPVS